MHFENFAVGNGQVWVLAPGKGPREKEGPFTGLGPSGKGRFWSKVLSGETVEIHYLSAAEGISAPPFQVTEVFSVWKQPASYPPNQPFGCFLDEGVYDTRPAVRQISHATLLLGFMDHSCTGVLVNDRNSTLAPFVLTAGHCVLSESEAEEMIGTFGWTSDDGSGLYGQVSGASLLARQAHVGTGSDSQFVYFDQPDFALLLLKEYPLKEVTYAAWSTPAKTAEEVFSVSNAWGNPQTVALGSITGAPSSDFWNITWSQGVTDRGSSGAGIFDEQGEIVAVVSAMTAFLPPDQTVCNVPVHGVDATNFASIYPLVRNWLEDKVSVTVPPTFADGSVVDAATNMSDPVPGSLASLYTSGMTIAKGVVSAQGFPLPTELGGISVEVNGTKAPLLAVAGLDTYQQINFQIPWDQADLIKFVFTVKDTSGKILYNRIARVGAGLGAVYEDSQGYAAALHTSDYRPVTASDPALPGESIAMFASGLGPVAPAQVSGQPAPASPPATTSRLASVDLFYSAELAYPCVTLFTGLAPGFAGVYQVNFTVPNYVPPGEYGLSINGPNTNRPKFVVGAAH